RFSDVAGSHFVRGFIRHRELGDFDPWRVEAAFGRQRFGEISATDLPLTTSYLSGNVGHLVGSTSKTFTVPYAGFAYDHAQVTAWRDSTGSMVEHRDFFGINLGLLRRAARFDTLGWLADGRGFLDIPVGVESDLLLSPGVDRDQHASALRY